MSDFDEAIGDMTATLLEEAGESYVYRRGSTSTTITLRKSTLRPTVMETGNGMLMEVRSVDFIALTTSLPYVTPQAGDLIIRGADTWEVSPTINEKVFRQISPQMTRLHTRYLG